MRTSFLRFMLLFLRYHIPFFFSFFLLLVGLLPWRVAFWSHFAVPLVYASLFCWVVFRPDLLMVPAVFLLGLSADLLTISPLGYYTFLFLIFYWAVLLERRYFVGRPFWFLWSAFGAFVCPLMIAQWLLASLLNLSWLSFSFFLGQGILLIMLFPFVSACSTFLYLKYLEN